MEDSFNYNYPAFLSLKSRKCLIIGFGNVGQRKLQGLLPYAPSSILVIDKKKCAALGERAQKLLCKPFVQYREGSFSREDIITSFIVFAATDESRVNDQISLICDRENILCNNVTNPLLGSFIVPASIHAGAVTIAVSTNGASPILARELLGGIKEHIQKDIAFADLMTNLRPVVKKAFKTQAERAKMYEALLSSPLRRLKIGSIQAKHREWLYSRFPHAFRKDLENIIEQTESQWLRD